MLQTPTHLDDFTDAGAYTTGLLGAQNLCDTASDKPTGLDKVHPFISISNNYQIVNMPTIHNFPNNIPVYEKTGINLIGDYCSELVAKLLNIQPRAMTFDPKLWPEEKYQKLNYRPGISPKLLLEAMIRIDFFP